MPLGAKSFDLDVFGFPNLQTEDRSKSKLLASRGVTSGYKSFEFDVLGSKNIEFKGFNVLGPCPWMLKALICMFFDFQTSKPGGPSPIEAFSIKGHDARF